MFDFFKRLSGDMAAHAGLMMIGLASTLADTTTSTVDTSVPAPAPGDDGAPLTVVLPVVGIVLTTIVLSVGFYSCRRNERNAEIARLNARAGGFQFANQLYTALVLPEPKRTQDWNAFSRYAARLERLILGIDPDNVRNTLQIPPASIPQMIPLILNPIRNNLEEAQIIVPNVAAGRGRLFKKHSACCSLHFPEPPANIRQLLSEALRNDLPAAPQPGEPNQQRLAGPERPRQRGARAARHQAQGGMLASEQRRQHHRGHTATQGIELTTQRHGHRGHSSGYNSDEEKRSQSYQVVHRQVASC